MLAVLTSAGLAFGAYLAKSPDPIFRFSFATAYVALAWLGLTLLLGPSNILRHRPNPVSFDLRRDVGIWAALTGLAHVIFGVQVHLRGQPWLYVTDLDPETGTLVPRWDLFGWANESGIAATLVLVVLLAISNDLALRTLGTRGWKTVQRLNYALLAVVMLHGFLYQEVEKRAPAFQTVLIAVIAVVAVLQGAGIAIRLARAVRTRRAPRPSNPG